MPNTNYNFSLSKAEELSPKRIRQQIVRDLDNMNRTNAFIADQVFPLTQLGASEEIFHRQDGSRMPMPGAGLTSESPTVGLEDLDEDTISVETFKEKISPEKYVDGALNSQQEILRVAQRVAGALRHDLLAARSMVAWRSYNGIDGMVGAEGDSAHPDIDTTHVITPSAAYSDDSNSDPHTDFFNAKYLIRDDGSGFEMLNEMVVYMSPSAIRDLSTHADLESRFSGVQVQNIDEREILESVLPIGRIQEINTKVVRTNSNGEPIDENGNVVDSPSDAAKDNILEPYNESAGTTKRNIVIGMPGEASAVMPWMTDRLASHIEEAPTSDWAVNMQNGFLVQSWAENDPAVSYRKIAQEIGLKLVRPNNWAVIQDI